MMKMNIKVKVEGYPPPWGKGVAVGSSGWARGYEPANMVENHAICAIIKTLFQRQVVQFFLVWGISMKKFEWQCNLIPESMPWDHIRLGFAEFASLSNVMNNCRTQHCVRVID